jgi:predicted Rossmann fold flavoprotein
MKKYDIIVIGAGASGLIAAGRAAELGKRVLLVEKMKKAGRKLAITGKGRCNITNTVPQKEFIKQVSPNGRFLYSVFSQFFSNELIEFINKIGLPTIEERGLRVFPKSGKALDVVNVLAKWCTKNNVEILTDSGCQKVLIENKKVIGTRILTSNKTTDYYAKKVIIATGGLSYPLTGSTGDGYEFAKKAGHSVTKTFPSLVPFETEGDYGQKLKGLELKNINGTIWINRKKIAEEFGELSFMEFGVSGPIILTLSRIVVPQLNKKNEVYLSIDLKPALSIVKLNNRLIREFDNNGKVEFRLILKSLIPKNLIPICLRELRIPADKLGHQINAKERKQLLNWLKDFRIKITGIRPYDEAIITAGGISIKEIDQKTLESKLVKGLYFAGEIIDVDGPTGGYNLQIAFSTGWVAGEAAAN